MPATASTNQDTTTSYKSVVPFYAYAALSFLILCVLFAFSSDAVSGHYFHPKLLALTHIAALAWGTMMIMGAGYQLVPVIIEGPLYSESLAKISFWITGSGIPLLVYSFWNFNTGILMQTGGVLVLCGLILFTYNVIASAWKSNQLNTEVYFVVAATLWLCLTAFMGVLLVFNFSTPIFDQSHLHYLRLHAHMGIVGWFLLLVTGVASRLIPMFLLSEYKNEQALWKVFLLINTALLCFLVDTLGSGISDRFVVYASVVLIAIVFFVRYCYKCYQARMRKKVELPIRLSIAAVSFLMMPAIVAGSIAYFSLEGNSISLKLTIVYGTIIFLGWITAIIFGMTFKTLPFIIWNKIYHNITGTARVPSPAELFNKRAFTIQVYSYIAAFIFILIGILISKVQVLQAGAFFLLISALIYNMNVWKVLLHKNRVA
jgi:hypothetical protein